METSVSMEKESVSSLVRLPATRVYMRALQAQWCKQVAPNKLLTTSNKWQRKEDHIRLIFVRVYMYV